MEDDDIFGLPWPSSFGDMVGLVCVGIILAVCILG